MNVFKYSLTIQSMFEFCSIQRIEVILCKLISKCSFTPGKLYRYLRRIGCDRHTEVPVTAEMKTIISGYSSLFLGVKFIKKTGSFFEN